MMFKPTEEYYRKRAERARELAVTLPPWIGQHLLREALMFEDRAARRAVCTPDARDDDLTLAA
ncbi:hypothetical protein [Sphingomonas crocodyli]|uniref:hypothetical protein n=1 Tax=Sphingomonas crocodyli TaxID=1979270 RepID=UPI0013E3F320|nr:hypothetical protein [Sphingomonas crocodyli]